MRQSIRGFADAVLERAESEGRRRLLADELAAFRAALEGSEDLRRVLGDPGVPAHARRAVVTDLLASRAADDTTALAAFAVEADRATEVVDDLRWLAFRARNVSDIDEGPLGRSAATERIDGYAAGVLESVAAEGRLSEVEDELFRFARVVEGTPQLETVLTDRALPADVRVGVVSDLLTSRASAPTVRLAIYAATVGRPRDYVATLDWLVERVAAEADRRVAEVRSAVDLDDDQRTRLGAALGRITGHGVEVRVTVDPSVLGGFVATVGDTVVDGTARHRLALLKERLALPEATTATSTGDPS